MIQRRGVLAKSGFFRLWLATGISATGTTITQIAMPLVAAIALDASALGVTAVAAAERLPYVLFALHVGVWSDRLPRRNVMIAADLGRALALATIPIAYAVHQLSLIQLLVVAFMSGFGTVFFDVSYQSYLPAVVRRDELLSANAQLELVRSAALLAGPGLGGLLVQLLRAPLAIAADAASYLFSAALLLSSPPETARQTIRSSVRAELAEGWRFVWRNPYLRRLATCTAIYNFFWNMIFALVVVYAVRVLELRPGVVGAAFMIGNVGVVAAALTAGKIIAAIGVGSTLCVASISWLAVMLIPLAPPGDVGVVFLIVAQAMLSFGVVLYNVTQVSLRQTLTPDRLLGRMTAVMRFVVWGVIPLGALTGGIVANASSIRTSLVIGACGVSCAFLPVMFGPLRSLREVMDVRQLPTS